MNGPIPKPTVGYCAVFILAVVLAWIVQGAVPGFTVPTLGQAVWSSGFALSFADSFPPGLMATHFGAPQPAPIAFGLAGAYSIALLISAGLHPSDAYSTMVAVWITVAFVAAWRIALRLQVRPYLAILAAFFWISMPVVWVHARYSMLSLGFALLPFYFLATFMLLDPQRESIGRRIVIAAYYLLACLIAVFMDGYSFMMFAAGSSLLLLGGFINMPERRAYLLTFAAPVHVLAFGAAYVAFSAYIGTPEFTRDDMTFFRAWGADITFFLWPSRGVLWLWDALGLSELRTQDRFFGDESVWISTFILPFILVGLAGWFVTRSRTWLATAALVIALVGLYLSLGPSFKFYSTRPAELIGGNPLMSAQWALGPTGTKWIFEHVPGFRSMRAVYRWVGLAIFGFWLLSVLLLARCTTRRRTIAAMLVGGLLIASNLPPMPLMWQINTRQRDGFFAIDRDLVADMRQTLKPGEMVAFLPYGNDFFVNYLAPAVGFRSYNVGGDKNLEYAYAAWPWLMKQSPAFKVDDSTAARILLLLARREADAIVLPYIDLLMAAHHWPTPPSLRESMQPVIAELASTDFVTIDDRDFYAVVRLAPRYADDAEAGTLEKQVRRISCISPNCENRFTKADFHQVGVIEDDQLRTDGKAGFLHFGPYFTTMAGTYQLELYGTIGAAAGAWADVVSSSGTVEHGQFPLLAAAKPDGVILEQTVKLDKPVSNLEIRVWVSDKSDLALSGYRLEKID